jgi:hypothetical protein
MADDSIEFLAKYKTWIAVKKLAIKDDTKPEEIVLTLSGVRQSVDKKSFEILGIDTVSLDAYATQVTGGARKSYGKLAEIVQKLGTGEAKQAAIKACNGNDALSEIATTYLFRRVIQNLAFDFDVNPDMLQKAFPGLKIPKPLGRKPKA